MQVSFYIFFIVYVISHVFFSPNFFGEFYFFDHYKLGVKYVVETQLV